MRKKLDSENLGIILLNAFMDEFFPKEESSTPDMFNLFHYNGLAQSNINGQVFLLAIGESNFHAFFSLSGAFSSGFCYTARIGFKIDVRIESNVDLFTN